MPQHPNETRYSPDDIIVFADLVSRWEKSLFVTAYRILSNAADAEEARQNVLLRILDNLQRMPDSDLEPWIRRCVINESLAVLRRRKRELRANERHAADQNGFTSCQSSQVDHRETSAAVQAALAKLDPETRAILSMQFDADMTIREIAAVVEKPHTTVQSQLTAALRKLRSKLALFVNE